MPPSISEPSPEPEITPQRRRWPADYYSSATPDPVLPRGATYGCAAAAVAVLLVVFIGGAMLSGERLGTLIDLAMGTTLGEMRGMFTAEVTKEQKDTLEREIETMRKQLRSRAIPVASAQKFIAALDKAMRDDKITPAEVQQLTTVARNASKKRP